MIKLKQSIQRYYNRIKSIHWQKGLSIVLQALEVLPGITAWTIEAVSLIGAVIMIYRFITALQTGSLIEPFAYVFAAAALVALAILTDYYTQPKQEKQ